MKSFEGINNFFKMKESVNHFRPKRKERSKNHDDNEFLPKSRKGTNMNYDTRFDKQNRK